MFRGRCWGAEYLEGGDDSLASVTDFRKPRMWVWMMARLDSMTLEGPTPHFVYRAVHLCSGGPKDLDCLGSSLGPGALRLASRTNRLGVEHVASGSGRMGFSEDPKAAQTLAQPSGALPSRCLCPHLWGPSMNPKRVYGSCTSIGMAVV